MANAKDLSGPLKSLTEKCVKRDLFGYAENFCNLLQALQTGRWAELDADEQSLWLERIATLLHVRGLGESWDWNDPDYARCVELVEGLRKARHQ